MKNTKTFRLRIASRRQVTLPQALLDQMHLEEGDILEVVVADDSFTGKGLKLVPTNLFTPEILRQLEQREKEIDAGKKVDVKDTSKLGLPKRKRSAA